VGSPPPSALTANAASFASSLTLLPLPR
jgi:hypothetical protein